MRHVRFLERRDLLGREADGECSDRVLKMTRLGRADDRSRDGGLGQQPCQRHLCARNAALLGDLSEPIDNRMVGSLGFRIHTVAEDVALGARSGHGLPGARETSASQRAPGNDGDALGAAEADHLALFLAIEQVVVVLHGDENARAQRIAQVAACHLPQLRRHDLKRVVPGYHNAGIQNDFVVINPWIGDALLFAVVATVVLISARTFSLIEQPGRLFGRRVLQPHGATGRTEHASVCMDVNQASLDLTAMGQQ